MRVFVGWVAGSRPSLCADNCVWPTETTTKITDGEGELADRYDSTRRRFEAGGDAMLAEAEALLATARAAYAEGEMTLLELLDAAEAFREARLGEVFCNQPRGLPTTT